jgi:hypothetical protein
MDLVMNPPGSRSTGAKEDDGEGTLWRRWRSLSESEGRAIEEGDWDRLLDIQRAKEELRRTIEAGELEAGSRGERPELADLVALERQNLERLEARLALASRERDEVMQHWRRVRQWRVGGGLGVLPGWQAYS